MTPRLELLVRRLVLLAGDVRDLLAAGDWAGALPLQEEFDETFAALQQHVAQGASLAGTAAADLQRLVELNVENQQLTMQLQAHAGERTKSISEVRTVTRAYAPLGANHRARPRYVDGSA